MDARPRRTRCGADRLEREGAADRLSTCGRPVIDDELEIRVAGARISPARVAFKYEVVRPADGLTLVTGHTVHVTIDRDGRPQRLPERVKDLFA
jgi:hypothetical protein